jgi:hypothetical protein
MSTDQEIEAEIAAKGLTAPRVTPEQIEDLIKYTVYLRPTFRDEFTTLTLCVLQLKNGFTVVGKSACVTPENFDEDLGKRIARQDAIDQIWVLEGYVLKKRLAEG